MATRKSEILSQIEVSITKEVSVCSKFTSHPSKLVELSNLDRQFPDLMYVVFFYKNNKNMPSEISNLEHFDYLQGSLEEMLSIWYPVAGRFVVNPTDGKLNIVCNNEGVVLVEAFTKSKMSDLFIEPNGAEGHPLFNNGSYENLVFKPQNSTKRNIEDMPLLVAQVTEFSCGGYSLGIGISHSLFDATGGRDFLNAWSSKFHMSRNNMSELLSISSEETNFPVVHERGKLLITDKTPRKISSIDYQESSGVAAIDHLYQLIKEKCVTYDQEDSKNDGIDNNTRSRYVATTFRCSYAMITRLKSKVAFERGENISFPASCSSFEVLAAHLWKVRTRVLELSKEKMVCLQFAVDIRNIMELSSSSSSSKQEGGVHFSGNAYVLASLSLTAGEVEERSYDFIIKKIKEVKKSVTVDYVNSYINALEHQGAHTSNASSTTLLHNLKGLTIVSDWTRLSYQNINFFGEVACISPLSPPIPQVVYFLPPSCEENTHNGGDGTIIDVRVNLLPGTREAFANSFFLGLE